jgi:hypothetical protein
MQSGNEGQSSGVHGLAESAQSVIGQTFTWSSTNASVSEPIQAG